LEAVKVNEKQRLFITASPTDKNVSYAKQIEYGRRLFHNGHDVTAITVYGTGENGHGTSYVGVLIAGMCLQGKSREEVVDMALQESRKRAEAAGKKSPTINTHGTEVLSCRTEFCAAKQLVEVSEPD
jgi:hypothetical protein